MMFDELNDVLPEVHDRESGTGLLLELAAAVVFLRRGAYPTITVWDAIERACRAVDGTDLDWSDPDPLQTAIRRLAEGPAPLASQLATAIRRWLYATSAMFNEGSGWSAGPR